MICFKKIIQFFQNFAHQPTLPTIPVHDNGLGYPSMEIKAHIDQQFEQINQQFSELNLQYTQNYGYDQTTAVSQPLSMDYNSQQNFGGQTGPVDNNYNSYEQQQQSLDVMATDNSRMYGNEEQHLQQQQYEQVPNEQSDYWNQQHTEVSKLDL